MAMEQRIASNLAGVRQRIREAAQRSGRTPDDITLVAVTKYVGIPETRALIAAGCHDLGESRPQELWSKSAALVDTDVRWHMIGHLQRNKARRTLPIAWLTHSGDSLRLIRDLDRLAGEPAHPTPADASALPKQVLLEVNISGDESKHGFVPTDLEAVLPELAELPHVAIRGLMAMASLAGGADQARREFSERRQLRDRLQTMCPEGIELDELSMGMSGDFEVAIEEGATLVRVGSALFEGLDQ